MTTTADILSNEPLKEIELIKRLQFTLTQNRELFRKQCQPIEEEIQKLTNEYLLKNAIPIGTKVVFNNPDDWLSEESVIVGHFLTTNHRIRYYFESEGFDSGYAGFDDKFTVKE